MNYNTNQLMTVITEDDCYLGKEIIIEVGGTQIPLKHVYVVDQEMIDNKIYKQDQLGSLVLDLDV